MLATDAAVWPLTWLLPDCRCMAISAAVFVGGIDPWKDALIEKAKSLHVGPGDSSKTDVGPLISPEAKARAERLIQSGADQVDSTSPHLQAYLMPADLCAAGCCSSSIYCLCKKQVQ